MNINDYFADYKFLKNKIIVISAKNEASVFFKYFTSRNYYNLHAEPKYRNSYVAVVDIKREFFFENVSEDKYECSYQIKDKFIDISSAGYEKGNISSIKIGTNEYSLNKRGLNIAIFGAKSLRLIDKFYVDTNEDSSLTVRR